MAESIKQVLGSTLNELGLADKIKEESVLNLWSEVIGDKIRPHTAAKHINHGVLFVAVDNSTWAHQLLFMKEKLITKLNRRLNQELVQDIRFQVGHVTQEDSTTDQQSNPLENIELTKQEFNKIESITADIEDDKLQDKLFKLLVRDKKKQKWRATNNWASCSNCSVLIPPEKEKCYICESKQARIDWEELKDLLTSNPWLNYQQTTEYFPYLTKDDFQTVKTELSQSLETKLDKLTAQAMKDQVDNQEVRVIIQKYVMLETGVSPDNLTERLIKKVIGSNWMKVYRNL